MTQDEARPALERFIEAAWRNGKREVLVITGKGTRADGSIGVLRQAVPLWLNASPNRARVTAFTHAAVKDGGEGALYVRIKRRGSLPLV
jgi:DNA-nicking Smr family endonuclease